MAYINMTGKPDQMVHLRGDVSFGRKHPGVWHVMVTKRTARCGRFVITDVMVSVDIERAKVCNKCVTDGMEYGNVRVMNGGR